MVDLRQEEAVRVRALNPGTRTMLLLGQRFRWKACFKRPSSQQYHHDQWFSWGSERLIRAKGNSFHAYHDLQLL